MNDDERSGLDEVHRRHEPQLAAEARRRGKRRTLRSVPGRGRGGARRAGRCHWRRLPEAPEWKFVFVNHVTTNPFFVPTQYGAADASKLCDVRHPGRSTKADVGEMINAFNAAISAKADGIAVCVVDKGAFEAPIQRARGRGIPVVAYTDGARPGAKARLSYVGQDLYVSGFEMGKRIVELVPSGDVALFIATPGALNIQPRIDGAIAAIKQSGKPVKATAVATSPDLAPELSMIDAYYQGHKSLKGMFAVDAGDTQGVGQVIQKYRLQGKVKGGGYDLLPGTLRLIQSGLAGLHDRPAAVPPGLLPRRPAVHGEALRRSRRAVGHEHGPAVRDEGQRPAVPDDEDALPRQLERAQVSGHPRNTWRPPEKSPIPERRAGLGWRVTGAFVRRREASILVVAVLLCIYFSLESAAFYSRQPQEHHRDDGPDRADRGRPGDAPDLRRDRPRRRSRLRARAGDRLRRLLRGAARLPHLGRRDRGAVCGGRG